MNSLLLQSDNSLAAAGSSAPLHIYKFVTHFGLGGTELQVLELSEQFDPAVCSLAFGCMRYDGMVGEAYSNHGWDISEYPLSSFMSFNACRQMLRLARELRARRSQVMHSYNFYANVFSIPAARLAGVPCIVASIRDMGVYLTPMQRRVQRWVCSFADRVLVNAHAIRDWLIEDGYAPEKIRVIRNGARIPVIDAPEARSRVRSELGIPTSGKVAMMVSRLNPKKGVEQFIDAVPNVLARIPDAWFVIVGDAVLTSEGQERAYMHGLAQRTRELGVQGRILFTGMRRDVPHLLAAADVSILPSHSEGFPNTVIEAMASGLPVVASSVGGIPELIQHGRTGLLVPPGDVTALAESMVTVLSNSFLSRRLGEAARLHIRSRFSFEKMCCETIALYRNVLSEKSNVVRKR